MLHQKQFPIVVYTPISKSHIVCLENPTCFHDNTLYSSTLRVKYFEQQKLFTYILRNIISKFIFIWTNSKCKINELINQICPKRNCFNWKDYYFISSRKAHRQVETNTKMLFWNDCLYKDKQQLNTWKCYYGIYYNSP